MVSPPSHRVHVLQLLQLGPGRHDARIVAEHSVDLRGVCVVWWVRIRGLGLCVVAT